VEIAIPVLNEERALAGCVRTLHAYLQDAPLAWQITIVDNGSTDATWPIAQGLAAELDRVSARRLEVRGKGAAVKAVWRDSEADIVAYMDVDLSTGLCAFLPLIAPLASGHSEVAIGTRLAPAARIHRGLKREAVSRCYNAVLRRGFGVRFSDAACGFKAVRTDVAKALVAKVADDGWFFDTELLLLAEHNGLRIHEVAVDWIEDADSRVDVGRTAAHNLRCMARTAHAMSTGAAELDLPPRPALRPEHPAAVVRAGRRARLAKFCVFAAIGTAATLAHASAYYTLRAWWEPELANLAALLLTCFANTEANRRWTFRYRETHRTAMHLRAGLVFLLTYLITSIAVVGMPDVGRAAETTVLVLLAGAVTVLRFLALDRWVFRRRRIIGRVDPVLAK
jgi:putative flippase GtrA